MTSEDIDLLWVRIFSEFRGISQIWEPTTAKRMKIDPYCQRRNYSPLKVVFSDVQIALISQGIPPLGASNKGMGWWKKVIFELNALISRKRYEICPDLLLMILVSCICAFDWHRDDDIGWSWTSISSNFARFRWFWRQ